MAKSKVTSEIDQTNQSPPDTTDYIIVQAGNAWFLYLASEIGEVKNKIEFLAEHKKLTHREIAKLLMPNRVVSASSLRDDGVILVSVEKR